MDFASLFKANINLMKLLQKLPWNFMVLCLLHETRASKLQIKGIGTINNACPGSTLILECTVNGREGDTVTTVWEGTAFNGCNIILLHSRFGEAEGNSSKECNNGAITVQRTLRMEKNGSFDIIYVSQLKVAVTSKMIGESIDCSHDNGTTSILVGSLKLNGSTSCAYTTLNTSIVHLVTLENEEGSQDTEVPILIIVSSALVLLLMPLIFIVPVLLYGLFRKKLSKSTPACDTGNRTSRENPHCQVINYTDIEKTFDNKNMGIYCLSDKNVDSHTLQNTNKAISETVICDLNGLLPALRGQISSKWYSFGLAIGVPKQILNQLKYYPDEECLVEVLDYWLRHHPGKPTWKEIMEAKRKVNSDNE